MSNLNYIKRYLKSGLLLAASMLIIACEKQIDIDLEDTNALLVVEGEITSEEKAHKVILTRSGGYFDNQPPQPLSGAIVIINDGTSSFPLTETPPGSGVYLTADNVKGERGKTYRLTISNVDINNDGIKQEYEAECLMKATFPMDSVKAKVFRENEDPKRYLIDGFGQEPPTMGDFYLWKYYTNGELKTDSLFKWLFTDDVLVNGQYIPGLSIFLVEAVPGDTITVESRSITKEYFDFLNAVMLETFWNAGGFGGPPANIKGNISNGAQGFFLATEVEYTSTIIEN